MMEIITKRVLSQLKTFSMYLFIYTQNKNNYILLSFLNFRGFYKEERFLNSLTLNMILK